MSEMIILEGPGKILKTKTLLQKQKKKKRK